MKKTLFATTIFLFLLFGQAMSQKQFYFGLAGTGLSSVITNQNNYGLPFEMDYKITLGGGGNVTIGFDFTNQFGLKMEIGYAKLGQDYEDEYNDTIYTRKIKLNYLQLPLLFKYRTGSDVAKFYVMAGPQFNFLLSASQKYLKNESYYDDPVYPQDWTKPEVIGEQTITDRYNSLDVMARFDIGVDIKLADNLFLNAGMTMAYGFIDINASDWQIADNGGDYNPSHNIYGGINCGINYVLPLGSK